MLETPLRSDSFAEYTKSWAPTEERVCDMESKKTSALCIFYVQVQISVIAAKCVRKVADQLEKGKLNCDCPQAC